MRATFSLHSLFLHFYRFLESRDYFLTSINGVFSVTKAQFVTVGQKLDSHKHIETYV